MTDDVLKDVTAEERKFLHDISNHIVVAHGMATFALRAIKDNPNVGEKEVERLEKSIDAINRMTDLLRERRSTLHSIKV
jgi:cob(I)alamin adenosyltransferase